MEISKNLPPPTHPPMKYSKLKKKITGEVVAVEDLKGAEAMVPSYLNLIHYFGSLKNPDGSWKMKVDYYRPHQGVALTAVAIPGEPSLLEQINVATGTWRVVINLANLSFYSLFSVRRERQKQFVLMWDKHL